MDGISCPQNVEQIIMDVVREIAEDANGTSVELTPLSYLARDIGMSSIEIFEVLALIDARLQRRFSYEALIVAGETAKTDLAINEIADFVRETWANGDRECLPR